jgi:hypothetical integral membrane protein (TIGR02206 family)
MHPPSEPGPLFPLGSGRWTAVAAIVVTAAVLSWLLRHSAGAGRGPLVRSAVCWTVAGVLLVGFVVAELQRVFEGGWTIQEALPLHLCDIAIFVTAGALLEIARHGQPTRLARRLFELAFVWGMAGTTQAILTPDIGPGIDDHIVSSACVRYFILHGAIVLGVLLMTFGLRMRMEPGAPQRVWVTTLAVALVVMGLDWLTGGNYMYLMGPPAHPSIIDYFGRWPWSLLTLVGVGTGLILLCYVPFWLTQRGARRDGLP